MKMKIKQTVLSLVTALVIVVGFVAVLPGLSTSVFAAGACKDGSNDVSCVSANCSAISSYLSANDCDKLVSNCENTRLIGSGINQVLLTNDTAQGNCSNALRSCFENEVNTEACGNHQVIAAATQCNNGDVNADGACGMDSAIDLYNRADGSDETDYTSNKGARSDYIKKQVEEACKNSATVAEKRTCEDNVRARATGCYDQNGGTKTKADGTKIQQCMVDGATTPAQCAAAGGQWGTIPGSTGSDAGGCTRVPSTQKCKDGKEPDAITGKCADGSTPGGNNNNGGGQSDPDGTGKNCGQAETILVTCEGEGVQAIGDVLRIIVTVLTALIGVAAVGGLAWASILYAKAEDNQSNVTEARALIRNIVIGILLYGFMVAIVNWLVPGGVIG